MYKKKIEKRKKITALVISLILLFIFSFKLNNVTTEGNKGDNNKLKSSAITLPIFIDDLGGGDYTWEEAASQDWCSGSGTDVDPYLLENLEIDGEGTDSGILIENSEAYFTIRDCTIYNTVYIPDAGIYLYNVTNGKITGNNCSNNEMGIRVRESSYVEITGNIIDSPDDSVGISLIYSHNNIIYGNTIKDKYQGIQLEVSSHNTISGNNVLECSNFGIIVLNCYANNVSGNIANNNTFGVGIVSYMGSCYNNTVIDNTANFNGQNGIWLLESWNNLIRENSVSENFGEGIFLDSSDNNVLSGNIISNNFYAGISLVTAVGYWGSDLNNITNNIIYENYGHGINLDDECQSNNIWDNEIYENGMNGINLLETGFNDIYGNVIRDNNDTGIYATSLSYFNLFHENFFHRNAIHAVDEASNSDWNSTTIGNYWDNYTGTDTSPKDGIGDVPHDFGTGIDYLPIVDDAGPIITINSPNPGDAFDDSPDFGITIDEDYLWDMWYTLDGGATTYPFTDFTGTIDQAAWDAYSDGNITLTFYANDKAENVGSTEVIVSKDTQAPVIVIIKPGADKKFSSAFSFELEVTDPHLDTIWYSLDGGVTNFTADTPAEKIEKAAWSAVAKGEITITFYASDTLEHVASESVTIKKVSPAIGLDYVTTSILILAISGVAIISIITKIHSKKRIIHY